MKLTKIVVVVLLISAVMLWIRNGDMASILESLPLVGGHRPGLYDVGAFVMFMIVLWGIGRVARRQRNADSGAWGDDVDFEEVEPEDDQP